MKKINVGGIELQFEGTTADVVGKFVGDAEKAATDASKALDAEKAKVAAAEATLAQEKEGRAKDAAAFATEVEQLKAKILTPEQQEAQAADRAKVADGARAIDETIETKGKSLHDIRVAALTVVMATDGARKNVASAALRGVEPAKAEPNIVEIAFDAAVAAGATSARDFDPTFAKALAGDGEPKPMPSGDADGAPKLTGYARTLQKLNQTTRAAT